MPVSKRQKMLTIFLKKIIKILTQYCYIRLLSVIFLKVRIFSKFDCNK